MAFDGITMACVVQELNEKLLDGRVYKIAQPEKDEILLTIKAGGTQQRLSLNADASLPLIYLTQEKSADGAEFLYVTQKAYPEWQDRKD